MTKFETDDSEQQISWSWFLIDCLFFLNDIIDMYE